MGMAAEGGGCILMQNTCSCEDRRADAGRASQPAIHKSPTVSQVGQEGRVSNLVLCEAKGGGKPAMVTDSCIDPAAP